MSEKSFINSKVILLIMMMITVCTHADGDAGKPGSDTVIDLFKGIPYTLLNANLLGSPPALSRRPK